MKPSLYYRALLGECIPIPDMTAEQMFALESGIRNLLEAVESWSGDWTEDEGTTALITAALDLKGLK